MHTVAIVCPGCGATVERTSSGIVIRHVSPASGEECAITAVIVDNQIVQPTPPPQVKVIIAGSRTVSPGVEEITSALAKYLSRTPQQVSYVVCGCADGADLAGAIWARQHGIEIIEEPVTDADYKAHGRYMAPKMRNRRMAEIGDEAIVFWDGSSGGSCDMVTRMVVRDKPVKVVPTRRAPKRVRRTRLGR